MFPNIPIVSVVLVVLIALILFASWVLVTREAFHTQDVFHGDLLTIRLKYPQNKMIAVDPEVQSKLLLFEVSHGNQLFNKEATGREPIYTVGPAEALAHLLGVILPHPLASVQDMSQWKPYGVDTPFIVAIYDTGSSPIFAWLDSMKKRKELDFKIIDYASDDIVASRIRIRYPYARLQNTSLQTLMPEAFATRDKVVSVLAIPWGLSSSTRYTTAYADVAKRYDARDQMFYEAFFPYYSELLSSVYGFTPGRQLLTEGYVNPRVRVAIDVPLDSIVVLSGTRKLYQKVRFSTKATMIQGVRLTLGDEIVLSNQKRDSLNGTYYVIAITSDSQDVIAETALEIKQCQMNPEWLDDVTGTAVIQRSCLPVYAQIGDTVFVSSDGLGGRIIRIDRDGNAIVTVYKDDKVYENMERCMSNPALSTKAACESSYDNMGYPKPNGVDIWDRACVSDIECPFYQRGFSGFHRGGCSEGVCEMPAGVTQLSNRKYTGSPICIDDDCSKLENISFEGDVFQRFAVLNK